MLLLKNLLFTLLVPGTVAVYLPWSLARALPPAPFIWRAAGRRNAAVAARATLTAVAARSG